ncbi:MAG: RNHCP domain-containing protein [Actinomycetota bacterium]|nr:RNHCP domain-containing protein [Actinomycetota bacterium]
MPPGPRFTRRVEDFACERCGAHVQGGGYTNHCPACLWSKHVDVNPGDRENPCEGLMEPVGALVERGETILVHRCLRCGETRRNKADPADDRDEIAALYGRVVALPDPRRREPRTRSE